MYEGIGEEELVPSQDIGTQDNGEMQTFSDKSKKSWIHPLGATSHKPSTKGAQFIDCPSDVDTEHQFPPPTGHRQNMQHFRYE